jgi:hypothetical protein
MEKMDLFFVTPQVVLILFSAVLMVGLEVLATMQILIIRRMVMEEMAAKPLLVLVQEKLPLKANALPREEVGVRKILRIMEPPAMVMEETAELYTVRGGLLYFATLMADMVMMIIIIIISVIRTMVMAEMAVKSSLEWLVEGTEVMATQLTVFVVLMEV